MKIGLRTLKTGISVFICILISLIFNRETYVVSTITAVFTLREDMITTYKYGKHRVGGNIFGALFSILALFIFNYVGDSQTIQLFVVPLLIIGMVASLSHFGFHEGTVGACATFLTILFMIPSHISYQYAFGRIVDSFIGMFVAIIVNRVLPGKRTEHSENK